MAAYYNELDPFAAAWLRELIAAGHIAPGDVDERSIADVRPADLAGYTQHHFFGGIGGWSYALRLAGWPDDRPVWTGSCPCQPFSAAGRRRGFSDARHLWPVWQRLIAESRPRVVLGEQVSGPAGRAWFDAVCADLEADGYAVGACDLAAAGVGAPHIRQRLYWMAKYEAIGRLHMPRRRGGLRGGLPLAMEAQQQGIRVPQYETRKGLAASALAAGHTRPNRGPQEQGSTGQSTYQSSPDDVQREQSQSEVQDQWCIQAQGPESLVGVPMGEQTISMARIVRNGSRSRPSSANSDGRGWPGDSSVYVWGDVRLDNSTRDGLPAGREAAEADQDRDCAVAADRYAHRRSGARPWDGSEWLECADGTWRPTQSGLSPVAYGLPSGLAEGCSRGFGNAVVPPLAAVFIESVRDVLDADGRELL